MLQSFAEMLGYSMKTVFCFKVRPMAESLARQDLMARDLLQRRSTDAKGQTEWRDSPVVEAEAVSHWT